MRGNKLFQQPIYNSITLIIHVCACETRKGISSEKWVLYKKNTAAAGVGFTIVGVWSVCVYILYNTRGDQVKYNSLFLSCLTANVTCRKCWPSAVYVCLGPLVLQAIRCSSFKCFKYLLGCLGGAVTRRVPTKEKTQPYANKYTFKWSEWGSNPRVPCPSGINNTRLR